MMEEQITQIALKGVQGVKFMYLVYQLPELGSRQSDLQMISSPKTAKS